jgi:hypothetical protein
MSVIYLTSTDDVLPQFAGIELPSCWSVLTDDESRDRYGLISGLSAHPPTAIMITNVVFVLETKYCDLLPR